ncbi:MAG: STAS-like domain-containing protein [Hyphomicrobiaceae bacterium]
MVIRILDLTGAADTQDHGAALYARLVDALKKQAVVVVSFHGIDVATSSFVNTSFARLLSSMPLDELKRRLRVIDSNRQINSMIKGRLEQSALEFA